MRDINQAGTETTDYGQMEIWLQKNSKISEYAMEDAKNAMSKRKV